VDFVAWRKAKCGEIAQSGGRRCASTHRRSVPRMAEDAAHEEREDGLRDAIARGQSRPTPSPPRPLSDTAVPAQRPRDRTADHRDLFRFGLNDRQIEMLVRVTPKRRQQ
jgi:hypothetical protein